MNRILDADGLLILGTVDNIEEQEGTAKNHSGSVLPVLFERVEVASTDVCFPHIYQETRNKHQFTISYFSAWRKKIEEAELASDYVSNINGVKNAVDYYEDSNILASYDIFHFGEGLLSVKNFPLRIAEVCLEACRKYNVNMNLALDAGSGPGRTALELCKDFKKASANLRIDYIKMMIDFVQVYAYDYSEGFVENMLARAKEAGVTNLEGRQGDAHCQQEQYPDLKFDLITGCNLIDRLHTPKLWVQQSKVIFDCLYNLHGI